MKESTSPQFLNRTAAASLITGVLVGLLVAARWDWHAASGFMVGLFWSLANFAVLAVILKTATNPAGLNGKRLAGWVALKVVVIYGAALWILLNRWFPLAAFMAGLTWPLFVVFLRALSALLLRQIRGGDKKQSGVFSA